MSGRRDKSQKSGGQSTSKLITKPPAPSSSKMSSVSEELMKRIITLLSIHSYFQCDILLLVCLWLSFSHLWIQMLNVYGRVYYLWNWRQVGASFVGIVNSFVPYSVERPRRSFKELFYSLLSAERRKEMFWKDLWSLVECDEVNSVFSNALLLFFALLPIDGDSATIFSNISTISHWIFSVVLLNIRTSDGIIRCSQVLHFISARFAIRWIRHPSVIYLLEMIVSTVFILASIFFFIIISPINNTSSKTGQLLLEFDTVMEISLSWFTAILPVFLLLIYQRHRSHLHFHLQQLVHDLSMSNTKRTQRFTAMYAFHRKWMLWVVVMWLQIVKSDLRSIALRQHQFSLLTQASLLFICSVTVINILLWKKISINEAHGVRFELTIATGLATTALATAFTLLSFFIRQRSAAVSTLTIGSSRSNPSLNNSSVSGSVEKGQLSPLRGIAAPLTYPSFTTLDTKAVEFQSLSQMLTSSHTYQNYATFSQLNASSSNAAAANSSREFELISDPSSSQDSSPSHPVFANRMRQSSDEQQSQPAEIGLPLYQQSNPQQQQQQSQQLTGNTKNLRKELQKTRSK